MSRFALTLALGALVGAANADMITQWNFDYASDPGTTTEIPSFGSGVAEQVWDTVHGSADSKVDSKQGENSSSDLTSGSYIYWSLGVFAGSALPDNGTSGAEFFASTVGFTDVSFSFDQRWTKNVSGFGQLQFTLDGSSWMNASVANGVTTSINGPGNLGGSDEVAKIDANGLMFGSYDNTNLEEVWTNGITLDFSGVAGAANDANFGVREVAVYGPNGAYVPVAQAGSISAGSGRWRFDDATFSGTPSTPEPASCAALAIGAAALIRKRRRA